MATPTRLAVVLQSFKSASAGLASPTRKSKPSVTRRLHLENDVFGLCRIGRAAGIEVI
jgi:hypothetical protein